MKQFIKFLVRHIPRPMLIRFSRLFSILIQPFYVGNRVSCNVCGKHFRKFLPYGNQGKDNRMCPSCLSLERHRLMWHYLQNKTNFFTTPHKLLHIAPEQPFIKRFGKLPTLDYTTADLESPLADIKLDIRQMPLADNTYDAVFCNHVMEHIDKEQQAMKEVLRVLKPGGWAILQVPINYNRPETYEDDSITEPTDREKAFGQYDHVREYGQDYPQRLRKAGFVVDELDLIADFSEKEIQKYRLDKQEILYICRKPNEKRLD